MKPNQLVNQMVNDAKVEPTPKPTIPEKPKAPNPVAEPKAAKPKPTIREQWDSWKRMKDTGSDYSIKKNNRLLNAIAEGIKPYVSPEEHDKWLDDGMAWKGEPQWLDKTDEYIKRVESGKKYVEPTAREKAEQFAKSKGYTGLDDPDYERAYGPYDDEEDTVDAFLNTIDDSMLEDKDDLLKSYVDQYNAKDGFFADEEGDDQLTDDRIGSIRDRMGELIDKKYTNLRKWHPDVSKRNQPKKPFGYKEAIDLADDEVLDEIYGKDGPERRAIAAYKKSTQPRTKVAGLKERVNNSTNMLSEYLDDFYYEDKGLTPQQKANKLIDEFKNYYEGYRDNYQDRFGQFLMDYGVTPVYYDDIYKDLVKIGYLDDPKYLEHPEKMMKAYSFNMMKAIERLAGRKIYQ